MALATTRNRYTVPLALLLLVIQGLAAGTVALAHASEHFSAPAHVEAQHDAGCVVLHDELRCALCQFAGSQVTLEQVRPAPVSTTLTEPRPVWADRELVAAPQHLTAPPRAPPGSRS